MSDCAAIDTRVPEGERYLLDREVTRGAVRDALSSLGIFKRVDSLPTANAQPTEDGIVLDLAFEDSALVHTGERTSAGFWLWLFTGFPGLCVHDQLYSVFYDAKVRVVDARSGETLVPWEPLAAPVTEGYALDFNERTSGFLPYVAVWIIPPTSLGIDPVVVARQILPPAMRLTIQDLVRIFNEIRFAPVTKVEALPRPAMGIRVDDARAEVKGGLADVTVHLTLAPGAKIVEASCGEVKVDLTKEFVSTTAEKPLEIVLPNVPVVAGEALDVMVTLEGQNGPQRVVQLTTTSSGGLRPERFKK